MNSNKQLRIEHDDLDRCISTTASELLLDQALNRCIGDPERLARFAALYVAFNAPFVSGVTTLSGAISARLDLFRDPSAPDLIADRSMEVARRVHDAVVDEFFDRTEKVSHRTLAQAFLKLLVSSVGSDIDALGQMIARSSILSDLTHEVSDGYGWGDTAADTILFALGWHMGSEVLADDEFNRIDTFLKLYYEDLVHHLTETSVSIGDMVCTGYFWIEIHTTVEKDHFELATEAANLALRYYAGKEGPAYAKGKILKGFAEFAETQKNMLRLLASS